MRYASRRARASRRPRTKVPPRRPTASERLDLREREGSPGHSAERALREVVERAVREPRDVLRALGEPQRSEVQKLYHSPELTILNVVWAPKMTVMPHDHRTPAIIGIYAGREDNIFWRRLPGESGGKLEAPEPAPCTSEKR